MTDHTGEAQLDQIPPGIRETYRMRIESAAKRTADANALVRAHNALERRIVPMLRDAGVKILAGSDAGPFNSYVYPGDALHLEMAELVLAGLSPLEALQAATVSGMEFFEAQNKFDAVSPGKVADLLLLNSNPLENIDNTRDFAGLVQGGRYISSDGMAELRSLR